jgi:hypothetical protein
MTDCPQGDWSSSFSLFQKIVVYLSKLFDAYRHLYDKLFFLTNYEQILSPRESAVGAPRGGRNGLWLQQ